MVSALSKHKQADQEFLKGISLLESKDYYNAEKSFKDAHDLDPENPRYLSFYGHSIAFAGKNPQVGIELCCRAIKAEQRDPDFYTNLSRIYIMIKDRQGALATLKQGMDAMPGNEKILDEFNKIGQRKSSAIPFLSRDNICNVYFGRLKSFLIKL